MSRHLELWLTWAILSLVVGYGVAIAIALAYPNAVVEVALLAFGWGATWISVTPAVIRWLGRRIRG